MVKRITEYMFVVLISILLGVALGTIFSQETNIVYIAYNGSSTLLQILENNIIHITIGSLLITVFNTTLVYLFGGLTNVIKIIIK